MTDQNTNHNITCLSDTLGLHRQVPLTFGDFLLHSGNVTRNGTLMELLDFLQWFGSQQYTYKYFIGGDYDSILADLDKTEIRKLLPSGVIYLNNQQIEVGGLHIFGSPNTKSPSGIAVSQSTKVLSDAYRKIPSNIDILMTHEAPFGINDRALGSKFLRKQVERILPRLHLYGHTCDAYKHHHVGFTEYINCSLTSQDKSADSGFKLVANPVELLV